MIDLKTVAAGTFIAAGMTFAAVGVSAGVASAAPASPAIAGPQYVAENGPGRGHGHGHDDWWWDDGPGRWNPIDACISASGPWGYVQGSACI